MAERSLLETGVGLLGTLEARVDPGAAAGGVMEGRPKRSPMGGDRRTPRSTARSTISLEQIVENAPVLIYVKDSAGRYLYLNRQSELVTGLSSDEALGQTDFDLYPPETAAEYRAEDLRALEATSPLRSRGRMLVGKGERVFSTVKFAVTDGKEVVGVCGISVETTKDPQEGPGATAERPSAADAYFGRLLASLTPQEVRVLDLVATGLSDREIAEKLSLSNDTVRHHVSHLLKKLRKRRAQVIIEMLKRGRV